MRGPRSRPCAVKPRSTARYPCLARAAIVAATASRANVANPGFSATSTTSAPYSPSCAALPATPGGPAMIACTSPPPDESTSFRAAVTVSSATLRRLSPRVSAYTSTLAMTSSEHLGFGLQQPDELRHRGGSLADDAARRPIGRQLHLLHRHVHGAELRRLRFQRFLLRRHDALERRVARARDAFVDGQHGRQRELDHLCRALELTARRSASAGDVELGHGGDARHSEKLRGGRPDDA